MSEWTASVRKFAKDRGKVAVTIEYSNGSEAFLETVTATAADPDWLRRTAAQRCAALAQLDDVAATIAEGLIDLTEPASKETPEEAAKREFGAARAKLEFLKRQVDLGIVKADDAALAALETTVKQGVEAGYLNI